MSSFVRFTRVDIGFDHKNVLTLEAFLNWRDPDLLTLCEGPLFVSAWSVAFAVCLASTTSAATGRVPLTGSWCRDLAWRAGRPTFVTTPAPSAQRH